MRLQGVDKREWVRGADAEEAALRRYFRAVLGDQQTGDRMVSALLPRIARTQDEDRSGLVGLFAAATRAWRMCHVHNGARMFSARLILEVLPPTRALARQAGVMVDVFGFTVDEAASVLNRSPGEVVRLLGATRTQRRNRIGQAVLVVEDEPLIAAHLAGLARFEGASHVATAASYDAAIAAAAQRRPDIVICDYDLGEGGTGVDVLRKLTAEHDCVTLFVTAYPEAVLTGSDGEPAFIIGKPFADDVIRAALHYAASAERPVLLAA
ncbi:response regulator [Parvularcula oceani]|uniref:response regulator n=1 Tax=Parvularcula oceani TaxID=1247963 RepID=UPI0004E1227C|nr:response regulator [Parvularcula oceani]